MEKTETSKSMNKANSYANTNFAQDSAQELTKSVNDITERVKIAADTAMTESVSFVKKYPMQTALGAVAIAFIAGFFTRTTRIKK